MSTATRRNTSNDRLTESQVRDILLSHESTELLATRYGVSSWTIRMIYSGLRYRDTAPDLERRNPCERRRTCWSCIHCMGLSRRHRGETPKGCSMSIPDQDDMGAAAGGLCNWHQPPNQEPAFIRELNPLSVS